MKHPNAISVIIATYNRPNDLRNCLDSLLASSYKHAQILIADQSNNIESMQVVYQYHNPRIQYLRIHKRGKANALNTALLHAQGDILAFTDDDCIVSQRWITNILHSFQTYPSASLIFGSIFPYQPKKHLRAHCPCLYTPKARVVITRPDAHIPHIGFGSNMACRKKDIINVGLFKPWLGPGSVGSNAEDVELALRMMIKKKKLLTDPHIVIYHNKWLSKKQMAHQQLSYICGEMSCYGYYAFQRYPFAWPIVWGNIHDSRDKLKYILFRLAYRTWKKTLLSDVYHMLAQSIYRIRGIAVGLFYATADPIRYTDKSP